MKRRFSFLAILISCGLWAQEPPSPGEVEPETAEEASRPETGDEAENVEDREARDGARSPDDFRPSQEISEDYPVPLPADI